MDLPEFIRQKGAKEFAAQFGVTERAAIAWQYRARRPRREVASRIVAETPVTWDGIYGEPSQKACG